MSSRALFVSFFMSIFGFILFVVLPCILGCPFSLLYFILAYSRFLYSAFCTTMFLHVLLNYTGIILCPMTAVISETYSPFVLLLIFFTVSWLLFCLHLLFLLSETSVLPLASIVLLLTSSVQLPAVSVLPFTLSTITLSLLPFMLNFFAAPLKL